MTETAFPRASLAMRAVCLAALLALSACGETKPKMPAAGSMDADQFLFQRGTEALHRKHWFEAQEYFRRLVESYPQSDKRQDAKLGLGDAYLGFKTTAADILAINEFREFLQFYPLNPRADYALYQICQAEYRMVLSPDRDQTATIEAMKDMDLFLQRYPTDESSTYRQALVTLRRAAQDRLSDHEFEVGMYYYRISLGTLGGAVNRFEYLLLHDPQYTRRDAVYFYLGESFLRLSKTNGPQALPYFAKIVEEFPTSKYFKQAQARVAELKGSGSQ